MLNGKKIIVVLPAYQAALTVEKTVNAIPAEIMDDIILVDDASPDETADIANRLGLKVIVHGENRGYGANQKTCYQEALNLGADVVIMLHPDYQYEPRLVTAMAGMVASGIYDLVIGSRILGNTARSGGMPRYKYYANRVLTLMQNILLGSRLSEFHAGYRAFSREVLTTLPLLANSDDFIFDNEILVQAIAWNFKVGEISCPTRYFPEASSINFSRSVIYGLGVIRNSLIFRLWRVFKIRFRLFSRRDDFTLE